MGKLSFCSDVIVVQMIVTVVMVVMVMVVMMMVVMVMVVIGPNLLSVSNVLNAFLLNCSALPRGNTFEGGNSQ